MGDVTLEVIGAEGVLSLDLFAQDCTVVREDGPRISYENWGDDMDGDSSTSSSPPFERDERLP